jgi:hypothetical protein
MDIFSWFFLGDVDNETEKNPRKSINPQIATTTTTTNTTCNDQKSSNIQRPAVDVLKILTDEKATLFGNLPTGDGEINQVVRMLFLNQMAGPDHLFF